MYTGEKPFINDEIDKIHLECDFKDGSIVNGTRQPVLYKFALDKPLGQKIIKIPRIELYKKIINLF